MASRLPVKDIFRLLATKRPAAALLVALLALVQLAGAAAAQDPIPPGEGQVLQAPPEGSETTIDDGTENSPATAYPIGCGQRLSKAVASASEVDWWVFEGYETSLMVVWVEAAEIGQPVNPRIKLYEDSPSFLAEENDDYDGKDSRLHYLAGDYLYYIKLEDLNDAQPGSYFINVDIPIYVSVAGNGTVGGVSYSAGDILVYYKCRAQWKMFLDMSDVSVTANTSNFATLDGGASFVMGFVKTATIPGVGSVLPQDLVAFSATDVGPDTSGTFRLLLDGSDVGLTLKSEQIDAVTVSDGRLYLSTTGTGSVPGVGSFENNDVMVFQGTSWGSTTAGLWHKEADGSDSGMGTRNLQGLWLNDYYVASDDENWFSMVFSQPFTATGGATIGPNDIAGCWQFLPGTAYSCGSAQADFTSFFGTLKIDAVDRGPHYHDTLPNFP